MDVKASTPRKDRVEKLSPIDGLFIVQTHAEDFVEIVFYCKDDNPLQKKADLISTVAGARSAKLTGIPFPKSNVSL